MGFMGKARDYMTSTIAIQPSAEAYYELAAVLAVMGDSEGSSDAPAVEIRSWFSTD